MKLLLTSDWQADFENLDLCQQAAEQIFRICYDWKLNVIVVAGDLKKAYNPVDIRVTEFWMRFIRRAREAAMRVILDLGNHDRVGMYAEAQNWFPILREAGAEVVHRRGKKIELFGGNLYCVPFSSSVETSRNWFREMSKAANEDRDVKTKILVFHNDLAGVSYNKLGQKSAARLQVSDMHLGSYHFALGGHVHLHQKIGGNGWYLGSPFATDWGEANQQKMFTVFDGEYLQFIRSEIPGWYDPSWPGFPTNRGDHWEGCRVRIHVPIAVGQNYIAVLNKAVEDAEKKYKGASVYTVPEFEEKQTDPITVKVNDPDAVKIRRYV